MEGTPGFPDFPAPRVAPDRYTVAEQSSRGMWVMNNDAHAFSIQRVNGQLIDAEHPVTLPSGATISLVVEDFFFRAHLLYDPGPVFAGLLTGSQAVDRFSYTVGGEIAGQRARGSVTVTVVGASDTDRLIPEPPFRALEYTASHPDLIAAFGTDQKAAKAHFETVGYREGREIAFSGLEYIASYADLAAAFGTDRDAGSRHFIDHGVPEGRRVTFDALQYTASYGDLIDAFGVDRDAAAMHYLRYGGQEGRAPDGFDAAQYLANYADLRAAFGSDEDLATAHFVVAGHAEGRTDMALAAAPDFLL
jgi:hypothetical protein